MDIFICKAGIKHEGGCLCTKMMLMHGAMMAIDPLLSINKTQQYT